MIMRQKPKDIENYWKIDAHICRLLNKDNILPRYLYGGNFYFIKNAEINAWLENYYGAMKGGERNE